MGVVGTIFLILFIVILLYFMAGIFWNVLQGRSGIALCPQHDFWLELPGRVKRSFQYCFSGCRSADTYEQI